MSKALTIVIPAYNEQDSLREFLPTVIKFCSEKDFDLIVVNDGSRDETKKVVEGCLAGTSFKIISHKVNRGYGGAIKTGVQHTETKYVITIDADGQHYLEDVEKLYKKTMETDADMVVGKRKVNNENLYRKMGKSIIRTIAKQLMPIHIHDINSGMKIYNTELAKSYLNLCPDSMAYSDIIALVFISQRHLVIEEHISVRERKAGKSTIGTRTAIETVLEIINVVVLFNPMRLFLPVSLFFILFGIIWDIPIFLRGDGVSVGSVLLIISGLMFFLMGLIAEQLSLIRKKRV